MSESASPANITGAFSIERRDMLEDFISAAASRDPDEIRAAWSHHFSVLEGARGVFVVSDPTYAKPHLPHDRDFSGKGFLRCWMADTRLMLVQNVGSLREFGYGAPIACDTNFVSFCEAFHDRRSLGAHENGFREALKSLAPHIDGVHAFPYLLENADNPNRAKVRATLEAFAAYKLTDPKTLLRDGRFSPDTSQATPGEIADECLRLMDGPDFRVLHAWVYGRQQWAKLILMKAALLVFERSEKTVEACFYALLRFLHDELARLPQFEVYAAYRFFDLSSGESFFRKLQINSRNIDRTLNSMAWDLAHWRSLFEMLTVVASRPEATAFPIPYFLSFDEPFVRLSDAFQLNGLIFSPNGRRCEHVLSDRLVRPVSDLLTGRCADFYAAAALADRSRRAVAGDALAALVSEKEQQLSAELRRVCETPEAQR